MMPKLNCTAYALWAITFLFIKHKEYSTEHERPIHETMDMVNNVYELIYLYMHNALRLWVLQIADMALTKIQPVRESNILRRHCHGVVFLLVLNTLHNPVLEAAREHELLRRRTDSAELIL